MGETVYAQDSLKHEGGDSGAKVDLGQYGTRHASAVNFVGRVPEAIVFVISQDGPIAGLTRKDENTVLWWPDCLSKLWLS